MESKGVDAGERSVSFVFVCFPWIVLLIFQKPIASGYMMSLLLVCLGGSHVDFWSPFIWEFFGGEKNTGRRFDGRACFLGGISRRA